MAAKYLIDRFTESNKAALSVAAKRRERLDEKQAMVISGLYYKLERCIEDTAELYFHGDEADLDEIVSRAVEHKLSTHLDKAEKSLKRLEAFHSKYCLYLPEHLDEPISRIILTAESHIEKFQTELLTKEFSEIDEAANERIKELRSDNILLLIELRKQFRESLLGDSKQRLNR